MAVTAMLVFKLEHFNGLMSSCLALCILKRIIRPLGSLHSALWPLSQGEVNLFTPGIVLPAES